MSFGKDPRDAAGITGFGGGTMQQRDQHRKMQTEKQRASRAGGGPAYWKDQFRLPSDHARTGRLLAGSYLQPDVGGEQVLEYVMFREHFSRTTSRGTICSAGPHFANKELAEPCEGCRIFWEEFRQRGATRQRTPNTMSSRPSWVFNWLDYGLWLNIPQPGKNGQIALDRQTQKPYPNWVPVAREDPRVGQYECQQGRLVAWPLSEQFKDSLFQYSDLTLRADCVTCGSQGTVYDISRRCYQCKQEVFQVNNTTLTPQQQNELSSNPYACTYCGHTAFLEEVIGCSQCAPRGLIPVRTSLFSVDLTLIALVDKDDRQCGLQILSRTQPYPLQGAPEPLDLLARYKPTPMEKQLEAFGSGPGVSVPTPQPGYATPPAQPPQQAYPPQGYAPQPAQYAMPQYPPQQAQGFAQQGYPQPAPAQYPPPGVPYTPPYPGAR